FHGKTNGASASSGEAGEPVPVAGRIMRANYYGSLPNSSWLTQLATSAVTQAPPPQDLEVRRLVFDRASWETPNRAQDPRGVLADRVVAVPCGGGPRRPGLEPP